MRHLVRDADLDVDGVRGILALAQGWNQGEPVAPINAVVGLLFLAPSTRTSLGFGAAAARLAAIPLTLADVRVTGPGLPPETLADTLRVLSGMSDVVVCRPPRGVSLDGHDAHLVSPLVNAGDDRAHPTQALIDLFAVQSLAGPIDEIHLGISGDLRARTVRSMLHVLDLVPPRRLSLFAPPGREADLSGLSPQLRAVTHLHEEPDFAELDVLHLPGLAPERDLPLAEDAHLRWGFSALSAPTLPGSAIVLSPGPVIDEVEVSYRADSRLRVFEQSDLGVAVRVGVLRWLLTSVPAS